MMRQIDRQGLNGATLRFQTYELLARLSEDQLLVVLAYARSVVAGAAPGVGPVPERRIEGRA